MFLGYAQNHMGSTYHMLNIHAKPIVISCDIIWTNKTYSEYVSRKENTKATSYILLDKYESYNWAYAKIDLVKTGVNTEDIILNKTLKMSRILGGEKTYIRLSKPFLS